MKLKFRDRIVVVYTCCCHRLAESCFLLHLEIQVYRMASAFGLN